MNHLFTPSFLNLTSPPVHLQRTNHQGHSWIKTIWQLAWVIWLITGCTFPAAVRSPQASPLPPTAIIPVSTPSPASIKPQSSATPSPSPFYPRLIGYYYGLDRSHRLSAIPADRLSVLIYAFIQVSSDGNCVSIDPSLDATNYSGLMQLKNHSPRLKTVISVGGWAHSAGFSDATASDSARRQLAQSCVAFMLANGFDGIDLDWEYPVSGGLPGNGHNPNDQHNFTLLLADLRKDLNAQAKSDGHRYSLSIAAPAGPHEYEHFELSQIHPYLDWITVMAYSFYTADSRVTNFASALFPSSIDPATDPTRRLMYNGDAAIRTYLAAGIPPGKLSLGVPFYGHGWQGVPAENNGLYQSNSGPFFDPQAPKGTWDSQGEITYRALAQNYLGKWKRYWQPEAKEPWLYNPDLHAMITFEDEESLVNKAQFVKSKGLGGISIWQISQDDEQHTLVNALIQHLAP